MSSVLRVCRKCGAKILADAPEGLCTACVLQTALGIFSNTVAGVADPASADLELDDADGTPKVKTTPKAFEAKLLGELGDYALL